MRFFFGRTPADKLPESFMFGVGNSDHQVESYTTESADVRDLWDEARGTQARGRATDFRYRYQEDVGLARGLGCKMFRVSLSWAWIEPSPGVFNNEAIAHYQRLVETIRANGMEPMVTLHHFVWPVHVQENGGMTADDFPERFVHYTDVVTKALGSLVRYWITFNEPNLLPFGYVKPWWTRDYSFPPGLIEGASLDEQVHAVNLLMHNLFKSHAQARQAILEIRSDALVSANPTVLGLPSWVNSLMDWNTGRQKNGMAARQVLRYSERPRLQQRAADVVIAALSLNSERAKSVDFGEVYLMAGLALLVPASADPAPGLTGLRVAVVRGSTAETRVVQLKPRNVQRLASLSRAVTALERGDVDAVFSDDVLLANFVASTPGRFRVLEQRFSQERYVAAVAKGHSTLLDAVSRATRHFRDSGAADESIDKNFEDDAVTSPPIEGRRISLDEALGTVDPMPSGAPLPLAASGSSLRRVQDRGYLIVAVRSDPSALSRVEGDGQLNGLEADLAREIARTIFGDSSRIRFTSVPTAKRLEALRRTNVYDSLLAAFSTLTTAVNANWWHLGMAGKLSAQWCPAEAIGSMDFVGLDYYWGTGILSPGRIQRTVEALVGGRFERAPVWPAGLRFALLRAARLFPELPVIVVENGCVTAASGIERGRYLERHVEQVQKAVEQGVPVVAYLCWSITSNREWGLPFADSSDFGLYHVDLDRDAGLTRTLTPSATTYGTLIRDGGVA